MLENIVTLICAMNSHLFNLVSGHTFPSSPTRYVTLFTSPLIKGGTMDRNTIKEVSNGSRVRECVLPIIFELENEPRLFERAVLWKRDVVAGYVHVSSVFPLK